MNYLKVLHHWKVKDKITIPEIQKPIKISDQNLHGTYSKHYQLFFFIFLNLGNKLPNLTERSRHLCYLEFPEKGIICNCTEVDGRIHSLYYQHNWEFIDVINQENGEKNIQNVIKCIYHMDRGRI